MNINYILNLKLSITFITKFKYNNNFILSDILNYNFSSDN